MSLYDKYGGSGTVQTLVQKFYNRIQNDRELEKFFKGIDFKKLIIRLQVHLGQYFQLLYNSEFHPD